MVRLIPSTLQFVGDDDVTALHEQNERDAMPEQAIPGRRGGTTDGFFRGYVDGLGPQGPLFDRDLNADIASVARLNDLGGRRYA